MKCEVCKREELIESVRKEELLSDENEALVYKAWLEIFFYFREGANVWITGYEKDIKRTLRKLLQEKK